MRCLAILVLAAIAGCAGTRGPAAREEFVRVFETWLAESARLDPNWATRAGLHEHDDRLTRYDDASHRARLDLVRRSLVALRAVDETGLNDDERIDARLFMAQLDVETYDAARRDWRTVLPGLPLGAVSAVHELLIKDFAPKEQRVRSAVARLRQVPLVCADARAIVDRPPALWTDMAIEDLGGALEFLDGVPELAGDAKDVAEAVAVARAAFSEYRDWLSKDVKPRSDGSYVYGREAFDFRLKRGHLLSFGADELAALGKREFDATLRLLDDCAQKIDPARSWRALLAEMMADHPPAGKLLDAYREEIARARRYMTEKQVVGIPDEKLELRETPAFMRSTVPFAAYNTPAPLDASRMGIFYVTPMPEYHFASDIPGTVWHEAYPGHHLQFVYAKDVPSRVRRLNDSPLLSEGWGFYCEELAHETGYYDDPRERLMQLNWRLQRAARIILDVGVHTGSIAYEAAVAFLEERVGMSRPQAESSAKGYTQNPTYFSCYMVGMLEILRIRERFRASLGARFTLKEFHERVLRCGNIPPALIEGELERTWR